MRFFGFDIMRAKAQPALSAVDSSRGWFPIIREPFAGAWQRNKEVRYEDQLAHPTVFACISLIASDFSKLRVKLTQERPNDIWTETNSPAFSPVLRKPNRFQNRIQFYETWAISKQARGNTVVLKERDDRGVVVALYILDWTRVKPLVATDGSIFYELAADNLSGVEDRVVVPASEIIHDRWNCLFHPLVGLSPLYAAGWLVAQGQAILRNATRHFENRSQPGGILTAPGSIPDEEAARLKERWEANYTGENAGRIAVLGNGLSYEAIAISAKESQLIEQLGWTDERICGIFRVPSYMAGVGSEPLNNNVEALAQGYYSRCLQIHYEAAELCLDEGLGIGRGVKTADGTTYGTEFDLDGLLRMDTATQVKTLGEAVKGIMSADEARAKINLMPVEGGDAVLTQQQNYSLAALAKRDRSDDPFGKSTPAPAPQPMPANEDEPTQAEAAKALLAIHKGLANVGR